MLKKFRFWFYRLLIIDCVGCGSLVVQARGLCLACENQILNCYLTAYTKPLLLPKFGIPFRFLFHWVPGDSDILSRYVYLLKSPVAEPVWLELSNYFLARENLTSDTVYVPIPSRKKRRHSQHFAQGLAERFGGQVIPALEISSVDVREQKRKSREERLKIRFRLNEEFTEPLRLAQAVILVDDVITTGASYIAAYNVLKNHGVWPENIELWTAFYRESVKADFE